RQDPSGAYAAVIPKFIKQLMAGETPVINGDGLQSRDFTYIDNVIEANMRALQAKEEACGRAYNIAYGGRVFLIDLYKVIVGELSKLMPLQNTQPVFGPDRAGDIKHSNADISLARSMLGYDPSYSFEDGIKLAIRWYKENLG
ncbi:MAG: GDP-mannose 4,6-dehydratase, partial [Clostridia bacterium]|nr:GDP-mannose 4,6-dehydratase [Clostridia bacterium]